MITIQLSEREALHLATTLKATNQILVEVCQGRNLMEVYEELEPGVREKLSDMKSSLPDETKFFAETVKQLEAQGEAKLLEAQHTAFVASLGILQELERGNEVTIDGDAHDFLLGVFHGACVESQIIEKNGWEAWEQHAGQVAQSTGADLLASFRDHWGDDPVQFYLERAEAFQSIIQKIAYEKSFCQHPEDDRSGDLDRNPHVLRSVDHQEAGRYPVHAGGDPVSDSIQRSEDRADRKDT